MLTPALRVGEPDPQAHGPHCVSTGRSPETSGPRRLNAPTPTLATVAEATPPRTGCPSCTVTQAAGRHAMVVAHFFESGQRRRLRWGRVESAPLMAGAVALASTGYIAAIDEKAGGPRRLGRASRFPQREPALPTETAREQSTRGASRVILLERGWIAAQLRRRDRL